MLYNKPVLRVEKQIDLLQERGLVVGNEERAKNYLLNISYYRLSAYSLPFQKSIEGNHNFKEGTTFNDILDLYLFDRELRLLVFDLIERLEIALRTQIIYQYSLTHGAWWYEDPALYNLKQHLNTKANTTKKISLPWVKNQGFSPNKLYTFLSCTLYLLKVINPNNRFSRQLKTLQEAYPGIGFKNMGFPSG